MSATADICRIQCDDVKVSTIIPHVFSTTSPRTLWDFRTARLAIPLKVVNEPCYTKVLQHMRSHWTHAAFLVTYQTHEYMIDVFAKSGNFPFRTRVFYNEHEAHQWLTDT